MEHVYDGDTEDDFNESLERAEALLHERPAWILFAADPDSSEVDIILGKKPGIETSELIVNGAYGLRSLAHEIANADG